MTDPRDRGEMLPDEFTLRRALREHYAAPAEGYWERLEARILERVRVERATMPGPWDLLAGWSRAGLVAAGIAALVAGLAAARLRQAERQVAFETVFRESSPVVALQTGAVERTPVAREATLRYLIAP